MESDVPPTPASSDAQLRLMPDADPPRVSGTDQPRVSGARPCRSLDVWIHRWFDWLDAHPERSWHEHATTDYLAGELDALGVASRRLDGIPGLIAEIPGTGPEGPAVALRADLDAIWHGDEETGAARHTCGHSGHMAIVLGATALLAADPPAQRVRILFQPAEETGDGALRLMEHGALEGVGSILGVHLRPEEDLVDGLAPSLAGGASALVSVQITGVAAHGARPHLGRNPMDAIAALHAFLASLRFAPGESWSAKITSAHMGGLSVNLIPDSAELVIDARAQRNEVMARLRERIDAGAAAIAALHGTPMTLTWDLGTPASEIDPVCEDALREAIRAEDPALLRPRVVTPGADDFHYYTFGTGVRGAMMAVGCRFRPGLHHPEARFETQVFPAAARVLARAVRQLAADASANPDEGTAMLPQEEGRSALSSPPRKRSGTVPASQSAL